MLSEAQMLQLGHKFVPVGERWAEQPWGMTPPLLVTHCALCKRQRSAFHPETPQNSLSFSALAGASAGIKNK